MATVKSLGIHEPAALPYLVAEGLLPPDPPKSLYTWRIDAVRDHQSATIVEEEVLFTNNCAVWSREGVVKRVYSLGIEGEPILRAFTTWFPRTSRLSKSEVSSGEISRDADVASHSPIDTSKDDTNFTHISLDAFSQHEQRERALVVVLKTQVHIYLLSGDSHVVPLSFEAVEAFPAPSGFLVERKLHIGDANGQKTDSQEPESILETTSQVLPSALQRLLLGRPQHTETKSHLFCFPEVLDEAGTVVTQAGGKIRNTTPDLHTSLPLSSDEHLIYISSQGELDETTLDRHQHVFLAVTQNKNSSNLTLWHVTYLESENAEDQYKRKRVDWTGPSGKRKSSNMFGRNIGTSTPLRPFQTRESFGVLAQSFADNVPNPSKDDLKVSQTTDLEEQLGPDFGEVGVQTRSARRISSMLARTDLVTGHERTGFNEIAVGLPNRKSLNRTSRRGESIGTYTDRQSYGRRRSSFQTHESVLSNGTSFLDIPGSHLADDFNGHDDLQQLLDMAPGDQNNDLSPRVVFTRIKSLPRSSPTSSHPEEELCFPTVFTISPAQSETHQKASRQISVCIMDKTANELAIMNLKVYHRSKLKDDRQEYRPSKIHYIRGTEIRRGSNIFDACKVWTGNEYRVLILTRTREENAVLHLEAPWSSPFRIDLPETLAIYSPVGLPAMVSPERRSVTGQHRVIKASGTKISSISGGGRLGEVLAADSEGQRHRVRLQLLPTDPLVKEVLKICTFVLPGTRDDGLAVAWWEAMRWLAGRHAIANIEYTALIVVLFSMALPFVSGKSNATPSTPRKKKAGHLRSSSGPGVDKTSWDKMFKSELQEEHHRWLDESAWAWVLRDSQSSGTFSEHGSTRSKNPAPGSNENSVLKYTFITDCILYAREFLLSPAGEASIGPEGHLPTAMNKDRDHRCTALPTILVSLHLFREELKLHTTFWNASKNMDLAPVLAQLGNWLGWEGWTPHEGKYYSTEIHEIDQWLFEQSNITGLEIPRQPFDPPSIFEHNYRYIVGVPPKPFPSLWDVIGKPESSSSSDEWRVSSVRLTPRLFMIDELQCAETISNERIRILIHCGIGRKASKTLPEGLSRNLRKIVKANSSDRGSGISTDLLRLLGRLDIDAEVLPVAQLNTRPMLMASHEAIRDYHTVGNLALETDNIHSWDATSEIDRQGVTRLIFRDDRRYQEASKLVNQTRPPMVECTPETDWTEGDLLDAQKELAYFVAHRTLSVASGRGMMHFNTRIPLLTEKVPIPVFSLQCHMKSRIETDGSIPMTFSADKAAFTEDKVCWAFFHNGASAGLMISKHAKGIDTSWILYNKPPELTNRHAGFLLALGLTGHLKNLAKWVAFKYLTPKHTMTSIGLLLGLSASYLGTMDTQITRLLSVHVTRLLPLGAAELNLSPLTQATSILGIGLLYCGSQHRRMSEIMLSEIENNDPEEGVAEEALLRNEGYRLAAGFALGFINLGQGKKLHSLHDMGFVERLLAVAVGTKNVNLVHVLDRATAGATIAIALVFMKTNYEPIARKIDIPDTLHQFDYVRPDIFLLRTVARHLIMWDSIEPTPSFMKSSLPLSFRHRSTLKSTKHLSTEDMPFYNITAGLCLSLGLRFAGSGNVQARDLLVAYLDQFIRLTRLPALNYDSKLTRNSVRNCQDVVALAASAVMAGTGDLMVLRRLRGLHGRTDQDTPYGSHLAGHMAIGALFLGGGTFTFGTSNMAVASLLCAFYPLFPTSVLDNKSHLQAFRHLWALAAEPRCIVCKDMEGGKAISAQIEVEMKDGTSQQLIAPCLLPELDTVRRISSKEQGYWNVSLNLTDGKVMSNFVGNGLTLALRRKAAYDAPNKDLFVSELSALAEQGTAPSSNAKVSSSVFRAGQKSIDNPFDWLFSISSLADLDVSERALILPPHTNGIDDAGQLKDTVVDTRLELENILNRSAASKDELWQLKLLFAWQDRWEREQQRNSVNSDGGEARRETETDELRNEVIDRLRWRVWNMTSQGIR